MRFSRSEAVVALVGWMCLAPLALAQQSGDSQTTPSQNPPAATDQTPQRPLTPEEQRQREIDRFDPLAKDPDAGKRPDSRLNQLGKPDRAAQDKSAQPDDGKPASRFRWDDQALPGSVAASKEAPATGDGPQVVSGDASSDPQYNGPAVLSRTYTLQRPIGQKDLNWSWTVGSSEGYTFGLLTGPAEAG
ncbi:MAG: hypothetical protein KGN84_07795, partial [Acidobacteriota bacterium]|nr:hypothetical protein [Acidobacteriota bacterium]